MPNGKNIVRKKKKQHQVLAPFNSADSRVSKSLHVQVYLVPGSPRFKLAV